MVRVIRSPPMGKPPPDKKRVLKSKTPPKIVIELTPEQLALFREFGAQGGATRARNLSAKERREGARKAAEARWKAKRRKGSA